MSDNLQLAILGNALYSAVLMGNAPPIIQDLRNRMRSPAPGDLVLEVSRLRPLDREHWDESSIGHLERIERENGEPVYYVLPLEQTLPRTRWTNAEFIALPTDRVHAWLAASDTS